MRRTLAYLLPLIPLSLILLPLILQLTAVEVGAEIVCGPCPPSFDQDVAIEHSITTPCVSTSDPYATQLEFRIDRQPGGPEAPVVADAACRITVALTRRERLRTCARFCTEFDCGGWSEWSFWIGRLERYPLCRGDLDGDGNVDGSDFLLFRDAFLADACPIGNHE